MIHNPLLTELLVRNHIGNENTPNLYIKSMSVLYDILILKEEKELYQFTSNLRRPESCQHPFQCHCLPISAGRHKVWKNAEIIILPISHP